MTHSKTTFRTLSTKYQSKESADLVATVYRKAGHDAVVVQGTRFPEYRVRIYTTTTTTETKS